MNKFITGMCSVVLVVGFLALSGCGKKEEAPVATTTPYGACAAGSSQTAYGCMPQGNCQPGMALYNNQCTPVTNNVNNGQTCTQAGQVNTQQYGCINQGGCPNGQAIYNNQCTVVTIIANNNYPTGTSCQAGFVLTQMGCLQQGPCQGAYGYNQSNNTCYPITQGYNNTGYGNTGFGGGFGFCIGFGCH